MYRFLPRECKAGTCDHEPGRCIRYRSHQCLSGECGHGAQDLVCGASHVEQPAPPAPPVSVSVDVSKPYGFRVVRNDGIDSSTLTHGYSDGTTEFVTPIGVAQHEAAQTRRKHNYSGPLRVYVWQQRTAEHYRMPLPITADRYTFPSQPQGTAD